MIKILIDSSADFPNDISYKNKVFMLPLKINFGTETYNDKIDMNTKDFYKRLEKTKEIPKTSQVSVNDFELAMRNILEKKNNKIIVITLSSALSSTYSAAIKAKELINSDNIYIIDGNLSILNGLLVMYAYKLIKLKMPIKQIFNLLLIKRDSQKGIFSLDSFDYLKRGGRINTIQFIIGGMLNIKPILEISKERNFKLIDRAKGKNQLFKKLLYYVEKYNIQKEIITIVYSGEKCLEKAILLKKYIKFNSNQKINEFCQIGSVMGSHAGPGLIGIAF